MLEITLLNYKSLSLTEMRVMGLLFYTEFLWLGNSFMDSCQATLKSNHGLFQSSSHTPLGHHSPHFK